MFYEKARLVVHIRIDILWTIGVPETVLSLGLE